MKATYKQYADHIYYIKQLLDISIDTRIDFHFIASLGRRRGGDAVLRRNGSIRIRIANNQDHITTLQMIMHELKHAQQMQNGRLSIDARSRWFWLGKSVTIFRADSDSAGNYRQSPWEIEAYEYQATYNTIFPNGNIPAAKIFVGAVSGVKFYKMKGI